MSGHLPSRASGGRQQAGGFDLPMAGDPNCQIMTSADRAERGAKVKKLWKNTFGQNG